jgi:hypothetical protein
LAADLNVVVVVRRAAHTSARTCTRRGCVGHATPAHALHCSSAVSAVLPSCSAHAGLSLALQHGCNTRH